MCFASRCRIPEPAGGACPASSVRRNCPQKEEFFMYPHPFSVGYWRTAANELKDVRKLTFAALCIALCMALAAIPSVPLWGGAKITWGFLARAVCAWVCGPVLGVVFAVAEDLLSFFITGGGGYPFFPGYTLTTMLGVFLFSVICFVVFCKCVNYCIKLGLNIICIYFFITCCIRENVCHCFCVGR